MMQRRALTLVFALISLSSLFAAAQERPRGDRTPGAPAAATSSSAPADQPSKSSAATPEAKKEAPDQPPVVTHHEVHVGGKTLHYTATTGMMPLKNNDTGDVEAHIFYIAYTLDGQSAEHRPLTFSFNGGPGSASVSLHMGAIWPQRVKMP